MAAGYTIAPADLSKVVNELLSEYGDDIIDVTKLTVNSVAEQATKKLRSMSNGDFNGTKYRENWKHTYEYSKKDLAVVARVYNDKHYRLTHLLEYGHALANGGRTRAFTHIEPVNNWVQDEFIRMISEEVAKL